MKKVPLLLQILGFKHTYVLFKHSSNLSQNETINLVHRWIYILPIYVIIFYVHSEMDNVVDEHIF